MAGTHFGTASADYERGRPTYTADAVAWLLQDVADPVLDLGAGTGKLTRAILAAGHEVTAVDPDPEMLATLSRATPEVPTLVGTAENLPIPDSSVGAVMVGQAWHWFDAARASSEAGRVVRPAGTLGLIWNIRDERETWIQEMTRILHGSEAEALISVGGPRVEAPFGDLETRQYEWSREMTRADVIAMASSRSYWIAADPQVRDRMRADLETLLDEVISPEPEATVALPYVTHAFRVRR
jgi:SAM-dependent methyltransferase